MVEETLNAAIFAAVSGNQINEIRMPAHTARIWQQRQQFSLLITTDIWAHLECFMFRRAHSRIVEEHVRRGLAQACPRAAHLIVAVVEIHVILFADAGDDILMLIQPTHDRGHIGCVKRLLFQETIIVNTILAIEPDNAIEIDGNSIQHDIHLSGRATGAYENLDAIGLQRVQRVNGGLRHDMRGEARQRSVNVEKRRFDVDCGHGKHLPNM